MTLLFVFELKLLFSEETVTVGISNPTAEEGVYEYVEEDQVWQVMVESSHDSLSDIAVQENAAYELAVESQ